MKNLSIGVVLVTFNRLEELKKAIPCYENQTVKPKYIIVVNNCSTDGTDKFLAGWIGKTKPYSAPSADEAAGLGSMAKKMAQLKQMDTWSEPDDGDHEGITDSQQHPEYSVVWNDEGEIKKILITIPENRGGSGGFYAGLKYAAARIDANWIWVADDDAFPEPDAFETADCFAKSNREMMRKCSAFCGMCVDDNKKAATLHQARMVRTIVGRQDLPVSEKEFEKEFFEIDLYTFAGTFLRREALVKAGLPMEDFFIYQDDYEHACRMRKLGHIYCVPGVVIHHNDNYMVANEVSWRDYYASRNIVMMYKWHFDRYSTLMRMLRRFVVVCTSRNGKKIKVTADAIRDGWKEIRGLHEIYRPGWKA